MSLTNASKINNALLIVFALVLVIGTALITTRCQNPTPEPEPVIKTIVDTVVVTNWQTKTIIKKEIVPEIRVITDSSYIAHLDTLITHDSGAISVSVEYSHPDKLFTLDLTADIKTDTVYINRERIITNNVKKKDWNAIAIAGVAGIATGLILSLTLQ